MIDEIGCQKCGGDGQEDHSCPFNEDIHGDYETMCNCCERCAYECSQDI